MTPNSHQPQYSGIPLNELGKLFYSWEQLGFHAMVRILFEFEGGPIDIQLLRQAYTILIKRRPVLNATTIKGPSRRGWDLRWMPRTDMDPQQAVRLCDFSALSVVAAEDKIREIQFDPFMDYSSHKDPPFFMALCKAPDGRHKLLVFIHHALTDASGIGLILQELFNTYNHLSAGLTVDDSECHGPCAAPSPLLPESRSRRFIKVLGALTFLFGLFIKSRGQSPVKILYGRNTFVSKTAAVLREVSAAQFPRYRSAAKRLGSGLNLFLVTAQIAAIDRWKRERKENCGLISMNIHTGLRPAQNSSGDLSNRFSTLILHSYPRHRTSLKTLLHHVHQEHDKAQRRGIAEKLICLLWLLDTRIAAKTVPLWGNFIFNNPRIGDSSLATNLGRLWAGPDNTTLITSLGGVAITACYMAGPPTPSMGSYFAYLTFNDRLYFTFNYFDWALSVAEANRFVDIFEKTLADLAECD